MSGDQSHKDKLEQLAYQSTRVKSNLNDNFYNENDNMDTFKMGGDTHKQDAQYVELLQKMNTSQKKSEAKDLSQVPQYKGKKVSAKDLLQGNFDDDIDEEEEFDENFNDSSDEQQGGEEQEENFEDFQDEDDESEEQNIQIDEESDDDDEDLDDIEEELDNEEQEEEELNEELESGDYSESVEAGDEEDEDDQKDLYRKALIGKKQKNINENKLDKLMNELEQEDKQIAPKKKEELENEVTRGKHTRNQILFWKQQAVDRMSLQKALDIVKKFPGEMNYFKNMNSQKKYLEILLLQNLNLMIKNRNMFFQKIAPKQQEDEENPEEVLEENLSSTAENSEYEYLEDYLFQSKDLENEEEYFNHNLNVETIQEQFEKSQEKTSKFIEDNILKWSQKTNLVSQNLKKQGFSQLLQTPIGQAQKAMKQAERMIVKSQLKRSKFRILGRNEQNLFQETDKNIYDDADYYHELMKEQLEEEGGQMEDEDGLDINNTKIYLLERKLKQQEKLASQLTDGKKAVDRRASKARKIRYNTHQKLVNFCNPIENVFLLEGRNEIIRSLFGEEVKLQKQKQQQQQQQQEQQEISDLEPQVSKKRKLNNSNNNNNNSEQNIEEFGEEADNFALI